MTSQEAVRFFQCQHPYNDCIAKCESEWNLFRRNSRYKQWIYLLSWSTHVFSWGTAAGNSDRIRKSSVFNPKLTGKYDRRLDYLLLNKILGKPILFAFEMREDPRLAEEQLKRHIGVRNCYQGLEGSNRDEISQNLVQRFNALDFYKSLSDLDKSHFSQFLDKVYFAKRRHPDNPRRTFFYGDCLEPGFLDVIGLKYLEPAIERTLGVRF